MSEEFDVKKSEEEWRKELSADEYTVAREKGTERPFAGRYWDCKKDGVYVCVGCGAELYHSGTKYDSGSGWPSFYAPVKEEAILEERDSSHGMIRVELMCRKCGCHLGHIFEDGPAPTGKRHCINSLSLRLKEEGDGSKRDA